MRENQLPIVARISRAGEGGEGPLKQQRTVANGVQIDSQFCSAKAIWIGNEQQTRLIEPSFVRQCQCSEFVRTQPLPGGWLRYRLGPGEPGLSAAV